MQGGLKLLGLGLLVHESATSSWMSLDAFQGTLLRDIIIPLCTAVGKMLLRSSFSVLTMSGARQNRDQPWSSCVP